MKGTIIFDLEGTLVDIGGESLSKVFVEENELEQLETEYELGIVTGATRVQLEYVLEKTFLKNYFNTRNTVSKDDCSEVKATGKPFQILLDRGYSRPVVIIGDSEGDQLGAEVLNVGFVRVNTPELMITNDFSKYLKEATQLLF
jgi:phosphoglycolate phosphatase-like HAD superfamily hydrolase